MTKNATLQEGQRREGPAPCEVKMELFVTRVGAVAGESERPMGSQEAIIGSATESRGRSERG